VTSNTTTYTKVHRLDGSGAVSKDKLWGTYVENARRNHAARNWLDTSDGGTSAKTKNTTVQANGSTMQVCIRLKAGSAKGGLRALYIAMHGGGGCPKQVNDSQYRQMQSYWFNSTVEDGGIYVAVRGITNSWKLHWENNSFPCYDRIIENCILLNNVDPDRVYLMGYSAGGDGVYRVTPVMPDRFAAVNMCAGKSSLFFIFAI
jgi:poly(3-hydroxybutyrate) depolymerase